MKDIFVNMAKETVQDMQESLHQEDWDRLRKVSHKIKPSLAQLNIESIQSEIFALEKVNPEEMPLHDIENKVNKTCRVLNAVIEDIYSGVK
jgi:HPt (histidine-containing phosphotransfer) domain-containing protein